MNMTEASEKLERDSEELKKDTKPKVLWEWPLNTYSRPHWRIVAGDKLTSYMRKHHLEERKEDALGGDAWVERETFPGSENSPWMHDFIKHLTEGK